MIAVDCDPWIDMQTAAYTDNKERGELPEALCRDHLETVAASVTFSRADQLRRLLLWLGARSLSAEQGAPSEKEIAESVLRRKDFDPQLDSLVRKEMSRLREKLARYYHSEGLHEPVEISWNGGYLFRFARREEAAGAPGKPCWLLLPFRAAPGEMAEMAVELLEELTMRLEREDGPDLISPGTALAYGGRAGEPRQFAEECRAEVVVEGSLRRRGEAVEAMVWIVDGATGRVKGSTRVSGANAGELVSGLEAGLGEWLMEVG